MAITCVGGVLIYFVQVYSLMRKLGILISYISYFISISQRTTLFTSAPLKKECISYFINLNVCKKLPVCYSFDEFDL